MRKIVFIAHCTSHVNQTLDKIEGFLNLMTGMHTSPDLYQPMARELVRDLIYIHNKMAASVLKPELDETALGFVGKDITGADQPKIKVYELIGRDSREYVIKVLAFIRGAINDPFFGNCSDPDGCEGFTDAAAIGYDKARFLLANLIERTIAKEEAAA